MDEKMKEALKGIYDNLSDELKEKAKQCKTMDELTTLAGKEGIELPDEVLDAVAGGDIYCDIYDRFANAWYSIFPCHHEDIEPDFSTCGAFDCIY